MIPIRAPRDDDLGLQYLSRALGCLTGVWWRDLDARHLNISSVLLMTVYFVCNDSADKTLPRIALLKFYGELQNDSQTGVNVTISGRSGVCIVAPIP